MECICVEDERKGLPARRARRAHRSFGEQSSIILPHSDSLRTQSGYPDVVEKIKKRLEAVRSAKIPVSLVSALGVFVATLLKEAPEVFEKVIKKDGTKFHCSDNFLRKWLRETMHWSERRATREAHKLPEDWEELCTKAFLRMAYCIKHYDIPSEMIVNTDQTQLVYAPGSKLTWAETGSKQVSIIGLNEKRALTLVVSVSNNGELLPFQSIYAGKTEKVTPSKFSDKYRDSQGAGFRWEFSNTPTYWSTLETMKTMVNKILVPYFDEKRRILDLPPNQKAIWQIDAWSVHRSEEFRNWMGKNHPNIILQYVPAGCTGVFQACDVGIQRILKHSLKRSYHRDIVEDIKEQLDKGVEKVVIDRKLGQLRDSAVRWTWEAYETLNKEEIVKKVSWILARSDLLLTCVPGLCSVSHRHPQPLLRIPNQPGSESEAPRS